MLKVIILVIFYFTFPLIIIYMCRRWSLFKKLGSIVLAYGFGLLLSITGIIPNGSEAYRDSLEGETFLQKEEAHELFTAGMISGDDLVVNNIATTQDTLQAIGVLAFPLLLFSLNIRRWLKYAKEGFISMALAIISIVVIIVSGYLIFRNIVPEAWRVGGMLVGVYTGGTPNMVSLKMALDVEPVTFIMSNTYDMIVGAATIIFFITAGPRVFRAILRPFKKIEGKTDEVTENYNNAESFEDYSGMFKKGVLPRLLKAFGLSVLILGVSVGISLLLFYRSQVITSLLTGATNEGLGGSSTLRGVLRNRVIGDGVAYGNFELRWKPIHFTLFNQESYVGLTLFYDAGIVTQKVALPENLASTFDTGPYTQDTYSDYFNPGEEKLHQTVGISIMPVWGQNFVIAVDIGKALNQQDGNIGFSIGLNYLF